MLIFLPSTQYAATASGSVVKDVTCESCGETYSYSMSRITTGIEKVLFSSSKGPAKASKKALANLAKALETGHDNVPCPSCKWHQSSHISYVRSQSYAQLKNLAGTFFIFAGIALVMILFIIALGLLILPDHSLPKASSMLQFALVVLIVASPGILLRGFRSLLNMNYRPNARREFAAPWDPNSEHRPEKVQ